MPIDTETHGLDWRAHIRRSDLFVALVTPYWHRDRLCQRQVTYARELGKPIVFLVLEGTRLPAVQEGDTLLPWRTLEEYAGLLLDLESGVRP